MASLKKPESFTFFRENVVYREWGCRLASSGKYAEAIEYFNKAVKLHLENDLRTELGLCKAQSNYAKYIDAEKTSQRCVAIGPKNRQAQYLRVETLFNIGEFSYSLYHAHRGLRRLKVPFEWGVCQGNETVEDCVGKNTSPIALRLLYPWIEKLQDHRRVLIEKLQEEEDEFEGIDEDQSKFKINDTVYQEEMSQKKLHRIIARIYLGHLANDKDFVEQIMEHPELVASANKKTSEKLHSYATKCYRDTVYREDVLRMRRPIYVTLFQRRNIPHGHKLMIKKEKRLKSCSIIIEADFLLRQLHAARMQRDYSMFFRYVDRIKDKFDSYSDKLFPLKQKCLNILYRMIAWAYIDTRNLMRLNGEETKSRYLKHHMGIHVAKLPRDTDLAWVPVTNRKQALKVFRRRIAMASQPLELTWLFHEFCKFLIEIHRFDLARFYAKKARDMGNEARSETWVLNANHLTVRIEIDQNNRNEAREAALMALSGAKKLGMDYLVDFYNRVLSIVDDMDIEKLTSPDGIAIRQQLILDLMPEDMKTRVDFLWRSMEVVPARRRMSVMPGCKPVDREFKFPCKRRTILPSPPKDPEKIARMALLRQYAPSKKRPGFVDFGMYE